MIIDDTITIMLMILATAFNGLSAAASLDQSAKQLPTRHKIGVKAFSAYSKASVLSRRGIIWYATIGIGSGVLTIALAINISFSDASSAVNKSAMYFAAIFVSAHSYITIKAAPINFKQRKVVDG